MKFSTAAGMGLAFAPLATFANMQSSQNSNQQLQSSHQRMQSGTLGAAEGGSQGGSEGAAEGGSQGGSRGGSQGVSRGGSMHGGSSGKTVIVIPGGRSSQGNGNNNNAMGGESPSNTLNGAVGGAGGQQWTVTVGGAAGLVFNPQQIKGAKVGDTVMFQMMKMNHSVTESTFMQPCKRKEGGMDSGFLPNPNDTAPTAGGPTFRVQVTGTEARWFYCRQTSHCGKGMVFSLNPTEQNTHEKFQQMALQGANNTGGQMGMGGQMTPAAGVGASSLPPGAGSSATSSVASVETGMAAPAPGAEGSLQGSQGVQRAGEGAQPGSQGAQPGSQGAQQGSQGAQQGSQGAQQGSQGAQQGVQGGNIVQGTGRLNPDGSCNCVAVCGGSSFGTSINGVSGEVPMAMAPMAPMAPMGGRR